MLKNREEVINFIKTEYPEIFNEDGQIVLSLLSDKLSLLDEKDKQNNEIFKRVVLVEKNDNIIGEKMRLLKLINKLGNTNK